MKMDKLEIIASSGNLSVSLPQERENDRMIVVNPEFEKARPQLQFLDGAKILKAVNYLKNDDGNWEPIANPAFQTYQPGSLEYKAFEIIAEEAKAIFDKFQAKYGF